MMDDKFQVYSRDEVIAIFKGFLISLGLAVVAGFLAYYGGYFLYEFLKKVGFLGGGGYWGYEEAFAIFAVMIMVYLFLVSFLFTVFGRTGKFFWLVLAISPIAWLEYQMIIEIHEGYEYVLWSLGLVIGGIVIGYLILKAKFFFRK